MIMMDQLLTTGWLAACAVAPTVAALSVWLVFMVHCYRNKWRNVDMFVMVIACQQVAAAFVIFAFSVVNVVRSRNENACNVVIWALTSVRVFQVSTLASLAFDRLMSVKWPYKYRFTIRTSQIKYHVAVLGVISCLVGTAGLFARASAGDLRHRLTTEGTFDSSLFYCSLHPSSWDFRFNVFLVALYGLLSVAIVLCLLWTELRRLGAHQDKVRPTSRISSLGDLVADPLSDQGLPKSITGSYRSLYGANLQNSFQSGSNQENLAKKVFCDKLRSLDLRWASVLGLIGLCYAVNHGPTLVFIVLGMVVPRFWNPVHDELIVWFTVAEG
ncbi:hypothetical protein HDE_11702 [Halotydeus destructor]|nr:hypothetical protein HDE_11702 [Halotydeus destructor]